MKFVAAVLATTFFALLYTASARCSVKEGEEGCGSSAASLSDEQSAVEDQLVSSRLQNRNHLLEFLRIPSVSTDPARRDQVKEAAKWLTKRLEIAGFENVQLMSTNIRQVADISRHKLDILKTGNFQPLRSEAELGHKRRDGTTDLFETDELFHPVVYADWMHASDPNAPTVLIYGHYDVQPEDPVGLWTSPPFEPEIRGDHLYARGASDDKGHMHVPIAAAEAWLKAAPKGLPVNIKFLFEGEEEVLSPHLLSFVKKHQAKFSANYAFSADGGQVSPEQPGLVLGLRGVAALQLDVFGAAQDSHSGVFGGGIANPLHALADLLASLHSRHDGHVLVPGFYEDVKPIDDEEREDFAKFAKVLPVDKLLRTIGANQSFGENGYTFYERTWARPSLEVVGMWGGFQGVGLKTVLPSSAHAKISTRLVYDQDPSALIATVEKHLRKVAAEIQGIRIEVTTMDVKGKPFLASKGGVANRAATKVLTDVYNGTAPVYFRMGGSIPVTAIFKDVLGLETVIFAFGNNDENVHAPDEFARLSTFDLGEVAYARLFNAIALEHRARGVGSDDAKCTEQMCNERDREL